MLCNNLTKFSVEVKKKEKCALQYAYILVQMSIEHMSFCLMVDHCLLGFRKLLVLFLVGEANPLVKDH